ncbi:hypothetical protein [Promicromonospora soli]
MTEVDEAFRRAVIEAADAAVDGVLATSPDDVDTGHVGLYRATMQRIKLLVAAYLADGGRHTGDTALVARAVPHAKALAGMQAASGLFVGGDNIESPPDTAFAINDVCDTLELIRRAAAPALAPVELLLGAIADAAVPAMVAGGVHTPNHRWSSPRHLRGCTGAARTPPCALGPSDGSPRASTSRATGCTRSAARSTRCSCRTRRSP